VTQRGTVPVNIPGRGDVIAPYGQLSEKDLGSRPQIKLKIPSGDDGRTWTLSRIRRSEDSVQFLSKSVGEVLRQGMDPLVIGSEDTADSTPKAVFFAPGRQRIRV